MTEVERFIRFPAGLFTPTIFSILFAHEIARAKRYSFPISLLILSIISPKPFSQEEYDEIEIEVAKILNSRLRKSDVPSRNGDEFLILLPNTDEAGLNIVQRRLFEILPSRIVDSHGKVLELSFNIRSASHPGGPTITAEILQQQAVLILENHVYEE